MNWIEHGCCCHQYTAAVASCIRAAHTQKHKDKRGTAGKRNTVSRSRGGENATGGNRIAIHGIHGIHA